MRLMVKADLPLEGKIRSVVMPNRNSTSYEMVGGGYCNEITEQVRHIPYGDDSDFMGFIHRIKHIPTLSIERLWIIYLMTKQSLRVFGSFFECGVYKGGTSLFLSLIMEGSGKKLHLFDTFCGMPKANAIIDWHKEGDFGDVTLDEVKNTVGHESLTVFHQGFIPDTFIGMDAERIAFAHIDTDLYQSTKDCCEFVYPRMVPGGVMIFDDYGQVTCDGVRYAVNEYFSDKLSVPLSLHTKQAVVFKIT